MVRASSRRRKDSAAATPAPVTTVEREDAGFVAPRSNRVDRVPVDAVAADAERNVVPVAEAGRRWIVPTRSDDEEESMPI